MGQEGAKSDETEKKLLGICINKNGFFLQYESWQNP